MSYQAYVLEHHPESSAEADTRCGHNRARAGEARAWVGKEGT